MIFRSFKQFPPSALKTTRAHIVQLKADGIYSLEADDSTRMRVLRLLALVLRSDVIVDGLTTTPENLIETAISVCLSP
jgi:hypothetical protein